MKFTREKPNIEGEYIFKHYDGFPTVLGMVAPGDWHKSQNPAEWYFNAYNAYKSNQLSELNGFWSEKIPSFIAETVDAN